MRVETCAVVELHLLCTNGCEYCYHHALIICVFHVLFVLWLHGASKCQIGCSKLLDLLLHLFYHVAAYVFVVMMIPSYACLFICFIMFTCLLL